MTKKSAIISAVLIGFLAVGALGNMPASAQDLADYPRIVQKIADRFGLDEDEVHKVFVEFREEQKIEARNQFYSRLNDLVSSGKLTNEQKQAIVKKFDEMKGTGQDLKDWAAENNIDLRLLPKMHFGQGKMHKNWP